MSSNKEIIRFEEGRYVGDVQGDIRHGWGKFTLWVGGVYEGSFYLNKMQGRGTFTYKNGDVYVGNWNEDVRSGFGKIDYKEGSSYEGSWTNDERSGAGTYYFENGDRYVGNWSEDEAQSGGKYYTEAGDRYEGDFDGMQRHGRGTSFNADGSKYVGDWSENQMNGQGVLTYHNGNIYEGGFMDGKRDGDGTVKFRGGGGYVGPFKDGEYHGNGVLTNSEGSVYEGGFERGKKHGKGVYSYNDGSRHEGGYEYGLREGSGTMLMANGDRFEGAFRKGMMSGQGRIDYHNGDLYEGGFSNDRRQGQGTLLFDDVRYEGIFDFGEPSSDGTYYYEDGSEYSGEARKGVWHGTGRLSKPDSTMYEGDFVNGVMEGQGTFHFANGNSYEGGYIGGKRNGFGIYHYAEGERYEGESIDGKREGAGVYHYSDGSRYEGEFANYKRHGKGVAYDSNGDRYEGEYRHGKRTGLGILYKANGTKVSGEFSDGELKSASSVPDISAEEMARRCDEVFANVSSFKSIQFDRKYNSFIRDMKDAIDDSSSMPTRLGELMSIHEFALQRREAGMAEEEARGAETEAPKPAPVVEEDTKSRLERRFKVVRHLKEDGGMAEVYLAQDNETGDRVIWKQAAPDRKTTLSTVNLAIENETEMLQSIDHPRIPDFIDSGKIINNHDELVSVLVMQYIEGNSLNQEMRAMVNAGLQMPFDRISTILLQLCEALEYLGDMDPPVFHRDVKPHNIMMTPYGGAVLIDFGLAKGVDAGKGTSLSGGNHTPGWAPPERENGVTGPTTDVYSLGQLLWHMLTNQRPGVISEEARLEKMDEMGHPEWLGELVNYSTVPHSPDERIQSVAEFRVRLENQGELP